MSGCAGDGEESSSEGESDTRSGDGAGGGSPGVCCGIVRERKAVRVPTDSPFYHAACCGLSCGLVLFMLGIGIVGSMLLKEHQVIGTTVLTVGPSLAIISGFYSRHRFSTTARQIWITFFEAILWMVPLLLAVTAIDVWNDANLLRHELVTCSWGASDGGEHLLWRLSWAAHCAQAADRAEDTFMSWRGKLCPEDASVGKALVSNHSSVPKVALNIFANDTVGTGQDGKTMRCPALDQVLMDVPDNRGIRVTQVAWGNTTLQTTDRIQLSDAHDVLFGTVTPLFLDGNLTMTFETRTLTLAHTFLMAYFRAGFLEELLKYIAVRRVLFKDRVVDCGGISVYGLAAGAGFATAENIQYVMTYGAAVTYARMVLAIPLHCCTGLIIGIFLGYRKFLGWRCYCLASLVVPVMVHGTYDFVLMMPESYGVAQGLRLCIGFALLFASIVFARSIWLVLDDVCVVDVRKMMHQGRVSAPRCCCQEPDCLWVWFSHSDDVLKRHQDELADVRRKLVANSGGGTADVEQSHSGIVRQVTEVILPSAPACQTTLVECPGCGADVYAHVLYPSYCPHCSTLMPDEVRIQAAV